MSILYADILDIAEKRLAWASERQAGLAQNIANLSTPDFQAKDTPDFQRFLRGTMSVRLAQTALHHLKGTFDPGISMRPSSEVTARTLDKNQVSLGEEMMKVADTESINTAVTAILKKYLAMFETALGKA